MTVAETLTAMTKMMIDEEDRLNKEYATSTLQGIQNVRDAFEARFGRRPVAGENVVRELAKSNIVALLDSEAETVTETESEAVDSDGYQTGDIVFAEWGYEQTNVDFFQIVKRTPSQMTLAPMESIETSDGALSMTGKVVPGEVKKDGKLLRRRLAYRDGEIIGARYRDSYGWMKSWDGEPVSVSHYA